MLTIHCFANDIALCFGVRSWGMMLCYDVSGGHDLQKVTVNFISIIKANGISQKSALFETLISLILALSN